MTAREAAHGGASTSVLKTPTVYERLGGDAGVRRLVHRFYALMDELPEARDVRRLHPADLSGSEDKLFKFLSGWFGGPPLYVQERGHPRLRMRHHPYPIRINERDQWLRCMHRSIDELVDDAELRAAMRRAFDGMADHLVNAA
jgi:hemoglobin